MSPQVQTPEKRLWHRRRTDLAKRGKALVAVDPQLRAFLWLRQAVSHRGLQLVSSFEGHKAHELSESTGDCCSALNSGQGHLHLGIAGPTRRGCQCQGSIAALHIMLSMPPSEQLSGRAKRKHRLPVPHSDRKSKRSAGSIDPIQFTKARPYLGPSRALLPLVWAPSSEVQSPKGGYSTDPQVEAGF